MAAVTATPKSIRPHIQVAEMEDAGTGYRYWSAPMQGSLEISQFLAEQENKGQLLSDLCCSAECWCEKEQ